MKTLAGFFALAGLTWGQASVPVQNPMLRLTAQTLSKSTTTAMFGRLPKGILAVSVQVCSNSADPATIPIARIIQQVKLASTYTILPKDAAASVVDAAHGSSPLGISLRIGFTVVELAAIAAGWSGLSETVKGTLNSAAIAGSSVINVLQTNVPSHTNLTFANEMLSDPLSLPALGCATGMAMVEADAKAKAIDFSMPIAVK